MVLFGWFCTEQIMLSVIVNEIIITWVYKIKITEDNNTIRCNLINLIL